MEGNTATSTPYGEGGGSPTWQSIAWTTAAPTGANELRFAATGAGTTSTPSASWPNMTVPGSVTTVGDVYLFTADTTGFNINTYDATNAHFLQFRWNWDNIGTFASAPSFSAYGDYTNPAASPGTQTGPGLPSGAPIINGSSETSNTSYLKANAYGYGTDASGTQQTPTANASGTLLVTSGTSGSVSPGSAAWLSTWQSLQAANQFISDGVIPGSPGHAGLWYFLLALYTGPGMSPSSAMLPCLTLSYAWS